MQTIIYSGKFSAVDHTGHKYDNKTGKIYKDSKTGQLSIIFDAWNGSSYEYPIVEWSKEK